MGFMMLAIYFIDITKSLSFLKVARLVSFDFAAALINYKEHGVLGFWGAIRN